MINGPKLQTPGTDCLPFFFVCEELFDIDQFFDLVPSRLAHLFSPLVSTVLVLLVPSHLSLIRDELDNLANGNGLSLVPLQNYNR